MDLTIRLNILRDAGQITEKTYNQIFNVMAFFKQKLEIELNEENGAMFITHLSSALTRIDEGKLVENIDEFVFEQVKSDINYKKSIEITNHLEEILGELPKQERDFIEMHICTLLNK